MVTFKQTRKKGVVQDVIQQIENAIVRAELVEGAKLPPERELQGAFQASRTTIREALRVLEQKGLITIRKGKGGGSFVDPKSGLRFGENLDLMIRLGQVSLSQLFEFRSNIEVLAFESAIYKATAADIRHLREIYRKMEWAAENNGGDHQAFFEIEKKLHRTMAVLSGNPLYGLVLNTITASTWKVMRFLPNSETEMAAALADWHDILDAMAKGDIHKATTVIRAHHLNYRRVYETYLKEKNLCDRTLAQAMEDVG
ncbi:GntR family transcriptional regulator [Desulfosarcina alkanivorans]|uniref:GntR family transcriptional regulator n=1 Tax=Desulfosarcina alkanivorans TaxID=571177 RepID=A0A5K7YVG7_9BACT|nr:FadR/GntR family transcriptional regulator [Desulfosarcina alkanivorans]BBO72003.1 GntR family transcriptional regulator [Desulfosarcina alkanivorans]